MDRPTIDSSAPESAGWFASARSWIDLLRCRQWVKNLLVATPLLAAHVFSASAALTAGISMVAFCLAASSVYLVNDLADAGGDRRHPLKRNRPLAAGTISSPAAVAVAAALLAAAVAAGAFISWRFLAVVSAYVLAATAYTFLLKRKLIIDAITLAGLYCLRILAGAVAVNVPLSIWLMMFSMFAFFCLALLKRYSELTMHVAAGLPEPANRSYLARDLTALISIASAAGFAAVVVFGLYLSSPAVHALYRRSWVLWLEAPLLLYWMSRIIVLAHRQRLRDDPLVFATSDPGSLISATLAALIWACAL